MSSIAKRVAKKLGQMVGQFGPMSSAKGPADASVPAVIGLIRGGRAGNDFQFLGHVDIPTSAELYPSDGEGFWGGENPFDEDLTPNDPEGDVPKIIKNLKAGKIWAGWDVYGEGVLVFAPAGTPKQTVKLKALEELGGESEEW